MSTPMTGHRMSSIAPAALALFALCCLQQPVSCRSQPPPPSSFLLASSTQGDASRDQLTSNTSRRTNIGRPIKFAVLEAAPYFTRNSREGATGFIADVVDGVSRLIDIQYDWSVERTAGKRRKDGNSTGVISKLLAREVDAGVIAINQHQSVDHRLITTHQLIVESTLSLLVNPDGYVDRPRHFYLEDLLNDTTIGLGHVTQSRVEQLLRHSELPVHQALWHRLSSAAVLSNDRESRSVFRNDAVFTSLQSGVQHVADNRRFILVAESSEAMFSTLSPPGCRLTVHDQYFPVAQYYFVVATDTAAPRNVAGGDGQSSRSRTSSPQWLIRRLDSALSQLHDTGVIRQLHDKWWTTSTASHGCSEPSTPGRSSSSAGRSPPSSPVGRQPPSSDDDWRARERIFFESPLRKSTTTTTTMTSSSTTTTTISDFTTTIDYDLEAVTSAASQDDVTDAVTLPEIDRHVELIEDSREATDAMTSTIRSEDEHASVAALTTSAVGSTSGTFETHRHSKTATRKPKRTTTMKPPRPHRLRHSHQNSGRRLNAPLTTSSTDQSVDDVIEQSFTAVPTLSIDDMFVVHGAVDDVIVDDADQRAYGDDNEQEMAVKDHWMRRQVMEDETARSISVLDSTSADDEVPDESFKGRDAATGSASCTSQGRLALVIAFVVNVVRLRFT